MYHKLTIVGNLGSEADTLNEQERRIASLEAEVAALKPYRDGYDFEKSSPPVGKIVLVQDCDSNFFSAKKPFDDCSFYLSWNVEENGWDFASGDGDWVRWYPEPPMPEVTE